jgi:hypothetical protein
VGLELLPLLVVEHGLDLAIGLEPHVLHLLEDLPPVATLEPAFAPGIPLQCLGRQDLRHLRLLLLGE